MVYMRLLTARMRILITNLFRDEAEDDELSELQGEAVPDEVRKWLASTFAKQVRILAKKYRVHQILAN